MIKKAVLLIFILIAGYLFFSYTRFYNFIGEKNLKSPNVSNSFVIGGNQGSGSIKYVALGDSLTAGVGSTNPQETFVYQYALKLSQTSREVDVLNLASPGDTSEDVLNTQIPKALSEKPDYVTLLIGINDIHGRSLTADFSNRLTLILQNLKNNTTAQITVLNLPYLGADSLVYPPLNLLLDFRTRKFNDIIASVASKYQIRVIDLYGKTYQEFKNDPSLYSPDLFHPSDKGYLLWSQLINAN